MLEHLIEQRQAICAAEIECKLHSELTNHQWKLVEKVVKVLKPFEESIAAVCNEPSLSALVIPVVKFKMALYSSAVVKKTFNSSGKLKLLM